MAATGEFRYDPLSYALNFDEGAIDGEYEASIDDFGDGGLLVYRGFSSSPPPRSTPERGTMDRS